MRAFRPSSLAPIEEDGDELERAREENLQRYAERAQAGLPLFEQMVEQLKAAAQGRLIRSSE